MMVFSHPAKVKSSMVGSGRASGRPRCGLCKRRKLNQEIFAREYQDALSWREWGLEFAFVVRMPRKSE